MKTELPTSVYLKDYQKPEFVITHTDLEVLLDFDSTVVHACHLVKRNTPEATSLDLNCEFMDIISVSIDDAMLDGDAYTVSDQLLSIADVPDSFSLKIENRIAPSKNLALSGLYKSGDMLCSQCEAEGYRRITPGIDRPDNLATYRVKLIAHKSDFPVLLCNGNLEASGEVDSNTHFAIWHDPFPKPTYLFAIVAGKLACLEDKFETLSGRVVSLKFWARDRDVEKCGHAMTSLKNSMKWDEQIYGREYDLDLFNVVAVDDFNMGAMENKSLNIFNTKYVLADSNMASDDDFHNVEAVIGHEYFHNWSGNRVTCRDWFQLSLKEGFTVFRDQEFSSDMGSRGVKRIDDVNVLRTHQFREDASPMAHSVRPELYQEINNFYTATIYNKGAEVVRMLHTMLGATHFRQGTDLYFDRYDGQAVTTDDFVSAMESVFEKDFTQFKNWYSQAGTPSVSVETSYDPDNQNFEITLSQTCPPTPGQDLKKPFVIPIKTALFNQSGEKLIIDPGNPNNPGETILILDRAKQTFKFPNIDSSPVPSLLREFSAPVILKHEPSDDDLESLLRFDDDPFNRWESAQKLYLKQLLKNINAIQNNQVSETNSRLMESINNLITTPTDDRAFLARLLTLPGVAYISEQISPIDPAAVEQARKQLRHEITLNAKAELLAVYKTCQQVNTGQPQHAEIAARCLRDVCLSYLCVLDDEESYQLCVDQLINALCMTDSAAAIGGIARSGQPGKNQHLDAFYEQWKHEPLVVDKWLRTQATVVGPDTLENVIRLSNHSAFDYANPNKVYSLILGFTHGNPSCFHAEDGSGYQFLFQWVEILDPINSQVSARLVSALNNWKRYTPDLKEKMHQTLLNISELPNLSKDIAEIVEKNLAYPSI